MTNHKQQPLRFPAIAGYSVRADFDGGSLSSDFGALLLRGANLQIGLTQRLTAAITERRHLSYIDHSMSDLLSQRIYQTACGYIDGNDANTLRKDPLFKLAVGRAPIGEATDLASAPTFSRLENSVSRKDIYRLAQAFVEQFIASYAKVPKIIVLDMDHSVDPTHGQQQLSFFNRHYDCHCYLPLFIFEGLSGKFISGILRPGKRPTGRENAAIMSRVLRLIRAHWPKTKIVLRGDAHFCNPELMALRDSDPHLDFIFGLTGNKALSPLAEPALEKARAVHQIRHESAILNRMPNPSATRFYEDVDYSAASWPRPCRVVVKAEVMMQGENPRFIATSLTDPTPELLYRELYCARGQDENFIKALKNDLASDRTSDHTFLANHLRMFYSCAAYVLIHSLRDNTLLHTNMAKAQPMSMITRLFKIAVRVVQYKDRIKLHLPSSCAVKHILQRMTEILYIVPRPPVPT